MNLNKLFFVVMFSSSYVFGQEIGTTEVKVLEGFRSQIPEASRLNENATFAENNHKSLTCFYLYRFIFFVMY